MNSCYCENLHFRSILTTLRRRHWDCAQKSYEENLPVREDIEPFSIYLLAKEGRLDCLAWLHEHKYLLPPLISEYAVLNGHYSIVYWMHSVGLTITPDVWNGVCPHPAPEDFLDWLLEVARVPWPRCMLSLASQDGNLELLKWLQKKGCPSGGVDPVEAAGSDGHIDCAKWLLESGFPVVRDPTFGASCAGKKEFVLWFMSRGIIPRPLRPNEK